MNHVLLAWSMLRIRRKSRTWLLSKVSWSTSFVRVFGMAFREYTPYWRNSSQFSNVNWPREKPIMSFFHGIAGLSRNLVNDLVMSAVIRPCSGVVCCIPAGAKWLKTWLQCRLPQKWPTLEMNQHPNEAKGWFDEEAIINKMTKGSWFNIDGMIWALFEDVRCWSMNIRCIPSVIGQIHMSNNNTQCPRSSRLGQRKQDNGARLCESLSYSCCACSQLHDQSDVWVTEGWWSN